MKLGCFSDADFAGDAKDSKSTSRCYLALVGTDTFIPASALSEKQGVASHSSIESEIVLLEQEIRPEVSPALTLWEHVVAILDKRTSQQIAEIGIQPNSNMKNYAKIDHTTAQLITTDEVLEKHVQASPNLFRKQKYPSDNPFGDNGR